TASRHLRSLSVVRFSTTSVWVVLNLTDSRTSCCAASPGEARISSGLVGAWVGSLPLTLRATLPRPRARGGITGVLGSALVMAVRSTRRGKPPSRRRRHRIHKTLAILSRKRSLYATRRLVEAVKERGHRSLVLD